jgi:hypothetical protein
MTDLEGDASSRQSGVSHALNVAAVLIAVILPGPTGSMGPAGNDGAAGAAGPPGNAGVDGTPGADGLGLISYLDNANGDLKVPHGSNLACTTATNAAVDSVGVMGQYALPTIGVDGFGLIGHWDATNTDVKVAHLSNVFSLPYVRDR